MKKLPLGIQTFRNLIEENYLYIDKTKNILSLISDGKYYFFSRPRRFGKSLLLATLKEIFLGSRELFKDLYIYDKIEWETYPIIHLDFSLISHDNAEMLNEALLLALYDQAQTNGIVLEKKFLTERFQELIQKLSKKGKVVILIDEYDKSILDHISELETAKANREVLKNFYSALKGADPYLRFVFLTGVTKFNKISLFSGLNNMLDITMDERYVSLLGITQEELLAYFPEYIEELVVKETLTKKGLLEAIKKWYNGYSWDGNNRVYNPTSLLHLFTQKRFGNYWFATGTPAFLIEIIKKNKYDARYFHMEKVTLTGLDSYEIEDIDVAGLMFQAGYLTVLNVEKKGLEHQYLLGFPNYEVKNSLLTYLVADFSNLPPSKITPMYRDLLEQLAHKDIEGFTTGLTSLFARIPYTLHLSHESYYHSLCYMILSLMGGDIKLEILNDKGRVDAVIEFTEIIYVVEFKMGKPEEALQQIKEKKYCEPWLDRGKELYLLGVGGFEAKQIRCLVEKI